jgi:cold shock protein
MASDDAWSTRQGLFTELPRSRILGSSPAGRYTGCASRRRVLCDWRTQQRKAGAKTMAQGTVKWFSQEKGYGFITPDEGDEDIFVHYTGITGSGFRNLEEGDRVSYEPTRGRKGEQAENVHKV